LDKSKSLKLPKGVMPSFPADPFDVHAESLLIGLERFRGEMDAKWGSGRLYTLVDSGFREKLWLQTERIWAAQKSRDIEKMDKAVAGLVKGYKLLDAWGLEHGVPLKPDAPGIEKELDDGSILVVVKDDQDAKVYENFYGSREKHLWTMAEIEILLQAPVLQEVIKYKKLYRGSKMTMLDKQPGKFPDGGATGFDDVVNDISFEGDGEVVRRYLGPSEGAKDGKVKA